MKLLKNHEPFVKSLKHNESVMLFMNDGRMYRGTFDRVFEIHGGICMMKIKTEDEGRRHYLKVSQIENIQKLNK